ncbi:MAG: SDR family oxidoreductase [Polyangiales bacterium]
MTTYAGKKAVVSGGSIGLGLAIARQLVAGGAEVLVTGRTEAHLARARDVLGPRAHVLRVDVRDLGAIDGLAAEARARLGALDAVFVNAGIARLTPQAEVDASEYDLTFAVNARGAFFTAQKLAPLVTRGGAVVFTTSIANASGYPGMSVYAGTKAAVRSFAQGFAAELLEAGVRVNALSPGFVETPTMGVEGASEADLVAFRREGEVVTPMKRLGTADEVARAALFLAFEATFCTGIELVADGGLSSLSFPASHV